MSSKVYEKVTEQIVALLDRGVVPWKMPYLAGAFTPMNLVSKKAYRGLNVIMLAATATAMGYSSNYWVTFNQSKKLGGRVRKGERGTVIVFWKFIEVDDQDNPGERKTIPFIRYSYVFNIDQTEGLEDKVPVEEGRGADHDPVAEAEAIVAGMPNPPRFATSGAAYYERLTDTVGVPPMESFPKLPRYYSTQFHEIGHATGHPSRLARHEPNAPVRFGSKDYSREELVAELTATFLMAECGLEQEVIDQSASYIENWKKVLTGDDHAIVWAASRAQKAADYVMGRLETETPETADLGPWASPFTFYARKA